MSITAATKQSGETDSENSEVSKDSIKKKLTRSNPLSRADWVDAARGLLIAGGIEYIRIGRLSEALNVTRGGFYWLFKSRDDLLNELLRDWKRTNTRPFEKILNSGRKGIEELNALFDMWLEEKDYSPAYDSAVRDWARLSKKTARVVKQVDNKRIVLMKTIFLDLGYSEDEAFIRARIAYFHQVGYYILGLGESHRKRVSYRSLYIKILSGLDLE